MNFGGVFLILAGIYLCADGVGSILEQPKQNFFFWQLVRVVRTLLGISIAVIGVLIV